MAPRSREPRLGGATVRGWLVERATEHAFVSDAPSEGGVKRGLVNLEAVRVCCIKIHTVILKSLVYYHQRSPLIAVRSL